MMNPIVLLVTWHMALHLMRGGDWCGLFARHIFGCTSTAPATVIRHVTRHAMSHLIRHAHECTHAARGWLCAPGRL